MKNNALINGNKILWQQINKITPQVYASIAIALKRSGWDYDKINDLFIESQQIWSESVDTNIDMIKMCLDETGIDVRPKKNNQ